MTVDDVLRRIAEALEVDPMTIRMETKNADVTNWDSMGKISLLLMIDNEFGIKLAPNETRHLNSVEGIVALLRNGGKLA